MKEDRMKIFSLIIVVFCAFSVFGAEKKSDIEILSELTEQIISQDPEVRKVKNVELTTVLKSQASRINQSDSENGKFHFFKLDLLMEVRTVPSTTQEYKESCDFTLFLGKPESYIKIENCKFLLSRKVVFK